MVGWWTGDSGKTLEVAHPAGLALDADSAVALALEDVSTSCVRVCAWAAVPGCRHLDGSHHDRVNKEGEQWHWHHSTSYDRSVHTYTYMCFLFKPAEEKLHRIKNECENLDWRCHTVPLHLHTHLCKCNERVANNTHLKQWIRSMQKHAETGNSFTPELIICCHYMKVSAISDEQNGCSHNPGFGDNYKLIWKAAVHSQRSFVWCSCSRTLSQN